MPNSSSTKSPLLPGRSAFLGAVSALRRLLSQAALGAAFFGAVTPIGLIMRLFGRDLLRLRRAVKDSYWEPKPPAGIRSYFREF